MKIMTGIEYIQDKEFIFCHHAPHHRFDSFIPKVPASWGVLARKGVCLQNEEELGAIVSYCSVHFSLLVQRMLQLARLVESFLDCIAFHLGGFQ